MPSENVEIWTAYFKQVPKKYRYIKIIAKKLGKLPEWHLGAGGKSWIFIDEIEVK